MCPNGLPGVQDGEVVSEVGPCGGKLLKLLLWKALLDGDAERYASVLLACLCELVRARMPFFFL